MTPSLSPWSSEVQQATAESRSSRGVQLGGEVYEELKDGLGIEGGFNQSWNGVGVTIGLGIERKIGSEDERIIGRGVDTTTDSETDAETCSSPSASETNAYADAESRSGSKTDIPVPCVSGGDSGAVYIGRRFRRRVFRAGIPGDRKSTRLNSSHLNESRMPSSA